MIDVCPYYAEGNWAKPVMFFRAGASMAMLLGYARLPGPGQSAIEPTNHARDTSKAFESDGLSPVLFLPSVVSPAQPRGVRGVLR